MKKLILPTLILGAAISFTSCKKDYTCDCTITTTTTDFDGTVSTVNQDFSDTRELKKKDAEEWCDAYDSTESTVGFGGFSTSISYSCDLK